MQRSRNRKMLGNGNRPLGGNGVGALLKHILATSLAKYYKDSIGGDSFVSQSK